MHAHTHRRALAAAARLALAGLALEACDKDRSEPTPPAPAPDPPRPSHEHAAAPTKHADAHVPATTDPHPAKPAPVDPIRACEGLVDEAFPQPSDYPGEKRTVGIAVKACCAELLVHGGFAGEHRWDCCANLPDDLPDAQRATMACTPWGPPVPPAMPRAAVEVA